MSHADEFPQHSKTSCSDENPCNADSKGHHCWRCNALLFDRLERVSQENEAFRTAEEKACTTVYLDLREELGLKPDQSLVEAVMALRRRGDQWKQIAINMHTWRDDVRKMSKAELEEAIRATRRFDQHLAALYAAMLQEMP